MTGKKIELNCFYDWKKDRTKLFLFLGNNKKNPNFIIYWQKTRFTYRGPNVILRDDELIYFWEKHWNNLHILRPKIKISLKIRANGYATSLQN